MGSRWTLAEARGRVRAVAGPAHVGRPPFFPEQYFSAFRVDGIVRTPVAEGAEARPSASGWILAVDPFLVPHTPQWNGALALALVRTVIPQRGGGEDERVLFEAGAAELLLPMRIFRPLAAATDLTMDGLRDLALRFAAPIRLTVRQWLETGTWRGLALLWRQEADAVRLRWRAASLGVRFPRTVVLGAPAEAVWLPGSHLYATLRTGRPHHGLEEVRTGRTSAWWFTRFGPVRDDWRTPTAGGPPAAVLALVSLARR